jgi:GntR family transcriptional repressor for pyruvate dehydrogenase complex
LAAMRVNDGDIAALELNLQTFRNQTRALELHEASVTDFDFHSMIVSFAGVQLFTDIHNAHRDTLINMIEMPRSIYNRAWEPVVEHERIVEALKRRDPDEARYYTQSHIVRSAERLGILLADNVV